MIEMMLMAEMQIPPPDIRGEAIFTSSGTWVCPEGVTSVCFVVIAPGVSGTYTGSSVTAGAGGALRYRNSMPVIPGQSYSIVIGGLGGQVTAFGTMVGSGSTTTGPATGGFNGSPGGRGSSQGTIRADSGKGGGYTQMLGTNYMTVQLGSNLYGDENVSGYGSGGYASKDGSGGGTGQSARPGACRIMWGRNRSFPANAKN